MDAEREPEDRDLAKVVHPTSLLLLETPSAGSDNTKEEAPPETLD